MFSSRGVMFLLSSSPLHSSLLLSSSVFHFWLCSSGKPIHRWFSTCWRQRRMLMFLSTVLLPKNLSRSSALNPNTINKRFLHWNTQSSQSTQKNSNTVIVTHGNSWTLLPRKGSGVHWFNESYVPPRCIDFKQPKNKNGNKFTPNQYTGMRSPRRWLFIWSSKDLSQTDLEKFPKNWNSSPQDKQNTKDHYKCALIGRAWPTHIPKHAHWRLSCVSTCKDFGPARPDIAPQKFEKCLGFTQFFFLSKTLVL